MKRCQFLLLAATLVCTGFSVDLQAQENPALDKYLPPGQEEIIVTATKRETTLMDTPVAVSAFSQEELNLNGVKDGRDIAELVPNLFVSLDQSQNQVEFTLRGIGSSNLEQISDPTVGLHVDGIYQPRPQGAMALMYDLERLEVLRGPQGTLFGRNSTVGTINVVPKKPDFSQFQASVDVDLGSFNKHQERAVINLPLSDNFALRVNYMADKRDSYITQRSDTDSLDQRRNGRVDAGDFYFNNDQSAARLSANWAPLENVNWLLVYETFKDSGAGRTRLRNCRDFDCGDSPNKPPATGGRDVGSANVFAINVDTLGKLNLNQDSVRSTMSYDFADKIQIKYSFGLTKQDRYQLGDDDAGFGFDGLQQTLETVRSQNESTSHEIQFQSIGDGKFQWTAGYWKFAEDNSLRLDIDLQFIPGAVIRLWPENKVNSEALFFEGNYDINPDWRLTAGVRRTEDKKSSYDQTWLAFGEAEYLNSAGGFTDTNGTFSFTTYDGVANPGRTGNFNLADTPNGTRLKKESDATTWKLGVDWNYNANTLLFATLATGYKAAPFDSVLTDPSTGEQNIINVKEETIKNLELGVKSSLLDHTLNLSANLFFSYYNDLQRTSLVEVGRAPVTGDRIFNLATINAAEANINGLEFEFDWLTPTGGRFSGFFTYTDAVFKDFPDQQDAWFCAARFPDNPEINGSQCPIENLKGNRLANTPEYTFSLSYEHTINLYNGHTLVPWVNLHWEDDYFLRDQNLTETPYRDWQSAWATVDVNLRYNPDDYSWYAELYGTNVFDELVPTRIDQFGGTVTHNYNEPRMFGARIGYTF